MAVSTVRDVAPIERVSKPGLRLRVTMALVSLVGTIVLTKVSAALTLAGSHLVVIWLPSGFLLSLLLLLERKYWLAVIAAAFLGNMAIDLQIGLSTSHAIAAAAVNALESLVAAMLLRRFIRTRHTFGTLREVGAFVIGAVVITNGLTALLGALVRSGHAEYSFWQNWFIWWSSDTLGMLTLVPAIVTVRELLRHPAQFKPWCILESSITIGAIGLMVGLLLVDPSDPGVADPAFMVFPLLIWAAVRFGPWGAGLGTMVLCAVTAWSASRVPGLFGNPGSNEFNQVRDMCTYLSLASLSALVPASIIAERIAGAVGLRESEGRFRQMAEHITEAFFVIDLASGDSLYTSPTWAEIWGRPIEDAKVHANWYAEIHPDDREAIDKSMQQVRRGISSNILFRITRPDGSTRWLRRRLFPVRDSDGDVYRAVGVSEDVTALRETENQLSQSQKMDAVGRLAGGVAHDFNNLLTVILSYSDLLLSELSENDQRRADIVAIRSAGESAAALTRQLLMFSRQEVLQPKPIRLNALIETTGNMLKRVIGENIELVLALNATDDHIVADPGQIEQIVVNLGVNARDAMPAGGKLLIETNTATFIESFSDQMATHAAGTYVMIAVSDTGSGMSPATQAKIFEPFFTTKEKGQGTGLGLSTVYGIVQQNGGFISVYSELGKGTSVKLYLPSVSTSGLLVEAPSAGLALPRGSETVLVVEDNAAVRTIVCNGLRRQGYNVLSVTDGSNALQIAANRSGAIDLLVTDVVMPGMSGRALADHFVAIWPNARVLFVSGYTDDAIVRHGILEAEVEYLPKPFTSGALARKVREVLDDTSPPKRISGVAAVIVR